ncbi:hypothetical protein Aperf_G00000021861 [Anoplocephala perfoliata]
MEHFVEMLVEMGYEKPYAELAVKETKCKSLEAALDWLVENPHEPGPSQPLEAPSAVAKSYVCEECGKQIRCDDDIQLHSARTGHINFKESSEEVKPLTEEEKKAKMDRLHEIISKKKLERAEQERQNALEDEKRRRLQGKSLISAKLEFKEKMMKQEAEQLKKQKAEDKAYREKVRAEIERDRQERIARNKGIAPAEAAAPTVSVASKPGNPVVPSTDCRLQIRTPIGNALKATFKPSEKLFDVIQFVCNNWPMLPDGTKRTIIDTHEVTLKTTFPTRKYTEEDKSKTLQELGLCPSAVIMAERCVSY